MRQLFFCMSQKIKLDLFIRGEIHHPFHAVFIVEHPKVKTQWYI